MDHIKEGDGVALLAQLGINLADDGLDTLLIDFLLEHLLQDAEDDLELLRGILGQFHIHAVRNAVGTFPDCLHKLDKLWERLFGLFVDLIDLAVQRLIAAEEGSFLEKIDLIVVRRIEVLHLDIKRVGLSLTIAAPRWLPVGNCLNDGLQLPLNVVNRLLLVQVTVPEVLYE